MITRSLQPNSTYAKNALSFLEQGKKNHQILLAADGNRLDTDPRDGFVDIEISDGVLKAGPESYTEGTRTLSFKGQDVQFESLSGAYRTALNAEQTGGVEALYGFREDNDASGDNDVTSIVTPKLKMTIRQQKNEAALKREILGLHKDVQRYEGDEAHDLDPRPGHFLKKYSDESAVIAPGRFEHLTFTGGNKVQLSYLGEEVLNVDTGDFARVETNDQGSYTARYSPDGYTQQYRLSDPEQFLSQGGNATWVSESEIYNLAGVPRES